MARTGRPRGFDREAALDAAMRLFWQHGYEGTSLDALRTEMGGISSASFYSAFGSKEALYREALQLYLATLGQVVMPLRDDALAPRDRVEQALRASARMQTCTDHPTGCMVTLSAAIGSPQIEALREETAKERRINSAAIMMAVSAAVDDGSLRAEARDELAALLDVTLNGLSLVARDGADTARAERAVDGAMKAWDSYATAQ